MSIDKEAVSKPTTYLRRRHDDEDSKRFPSIECISGQYRELARTNWPYTAAYTDWFDEWPIVWDESNRSFDVRDLCCLYDSI